MGKPIKQREIERSLRREKVRRLLLRGITSQSEIARRLGVNQANISRDFRYFHELWDKNQSKTVARIRAIQTEQLNQLLSTWFPLAAPEGELGTNAEGEIVASEPTEPDPRAARIVLLTFRQIGVINGLEKPDDKGTSANPFKDLAQKAQKARDAQAVSTEKQTEPEHRGILN